MVVIQLVKRHPARLLIAAVRLADLQAVGSIMNDAPIIANKMRLLTIEAHAQYDGAALVLEDVLPRRPAGAQIILDTAGKVIAPSKERPFSSTPEMLRAGVAEEGGGSFFW